MPGYYSKYIKLVHVLGDLVAVAAALCAAFWLAFWYLAFSPALLLYALLIWLTCATLAGTYKLYRINRTRQVLLNALKVLLLYVLLVEATLNISGIQDYPLQLRFFHYAALAFGVMLWRLIVLSVVRTLRRRGFNSRKVIIAGYGNSGQELARFLQSHPEYGYNFLGFFDDHETSSPHILGRMNALERFVLEHEVNEIYCCAFELNKSQVQQLLDFVDEHLVRMKFLPEPGAMPIRNLKVDFYDMLPVLILRSIPLDDALNKLLKRSFDVVFSLIVIVGVLSWLLPLLAILIKMDSRGPVFFGQERAGINNTTFRCWKLRSMYVNTAANSLLASRGDNRITPIGAFIRKTSLDELPQFFNVFLGQMSVVGPRPHMLKANREYALVAHKYMVRHLIKPGITGLSQVRGYRGDTTEDYQVRGRVRLDLFYLENWTFILDLKIIYFTITNMFSGDEHAF
ncbi:undecaprenyl-phosphate glucose phosphotransferase [Pontibacter sp. CAU 1760]